MTTQPNTLTLLFAGDTNLQQRDDPASAFHNILPTLREADVLLGQLEGPFSPPSTDPAQLDIPHKQGWRHSDPSQVQGLVAAGFDAVSCASNVTYGQDAVRSSMQTLTDAGIAFCGMGRNRDEAHRPAIVERGGVRMGMLSYTSVFWPVGHAATGDAPGVATLRATTSYQPHRRTLEMPGVPPLVITTPDDEELSAMQTDVAQLREEVDFVVVSCHWGVSSSEEPTDYQRVIAHAAIEAGADLIVGHHPHVLQEIEIYNGRPIFYSVGNFAFDWTKMRGKHHDGLLVRCTLNGGKLASVSFLPVRRNAQNLITPHKPGDTAGAEITKRVRRLSASNDITFSVRESDVMLCGVGQQN